MTDEERRARQRAKDARKRARRRARKLGLPEPVFEGVSKGGRPRVTDEQRRETRLRAKRREADRRWYLRNRDKILSSPGYLAAHPRQTRGRPPDAGARLYRECLAEIQKAAAQFAKLSPEEVRARRLERWRRYRARWKAANPDKVRESDRQSKARRVAHVRTQKRDYRDRHRDRIRAANLANYYANADQYRERGRRRNQAVTAAARYLRSIGLLEWWGPRETTHVRREAAYAYAKENGLV